MLKRLFTTFDSNWIRYCKNGCFRTHFTLTTWDQKKIISLDWFDSWNFVFNFLYHHLFRCTRKLTSLHCTRGFRKRPYHNCSSARKIQWHTFSLCTTNCWRAATEPPSLSLFLRFSGEQKGKKFKFFFLRKIPLSQIDTTRRYHDDDEMKNRWFVRKIWN